MKILNESIVESLVLSSEAGKNTKFLSNSHNLWKRFKNYQKSPPLGLDISGKIVCLIFCTYNRDGYVNLYEIVTIQGSEGMGYASRLWDEFLAYSCFEKKSKRLKLSCTPSSLTWHIRNGLVFWAIDPSGSLRSDQHIFPSRKDQLAYRENCINNLRLALPEPSVCKKLAGESLESHNFSKEKASEVMLAIQKAGNFWLRDALFQK